MKATFTLLAAIGLLGLSHLGQAQCVTSLVTAQSCTAPGGATVIADTGGANTNVNISGGTYLYSGTAGISNLNLSGGTLYYTSSGMLNGANISGGTLIYSGAGSASGINQTGGTMQVCSNGQLTLTGNLNGGSFVIAAGGNLTFPNTYTLQNSSQLTNYGTVVFQGSLSIASSSTGMFVNAGTLTASGQVFLNGPGFVNQGTASFGTLVVNGSGRACLSPGSTLNVGTYQTNDNANSMTASPTTAGLACIRVSGYGNFNALMATAVPSKVGVCRVGTASAAEVAAYGTAQVTQNCTSCARVLPVELVSFTATAHTTGVRLGWTTASERGSAYFDVERSADGHTFTTVGRLLAAGSIASPRGYAFTDQAASPGTTHYYRLRQADLDGTSTYSAVRIVSLPTRPAALYPNPAHAATLLTGAQPGGAVQLLDLRGRVVATATADDTGVASLELPAGTVGGVYVVRAGSRAMRLVVE